VRVGFFKKTVFLLGVLLAPFIFAGNLDTQAHFNTLSIVRETGSRLVFHFEMNLSLVMGKILDPQLSHEEFLRKLSSLSDEKFQKSIQMVQHELETQSVVTTAQGVNYHVIKWQFPEPNPLRLSLSRELAYLKVPAQFQAHVDPLVISAEIAATHPLQRVRLTLPESLMPIWVINGEQDKFWLSERIPLAVLDIP
jgi:hypothetical protein